MIEAGNGLRVFVVDDEEMIASSLSMILRLHGGIHATSFTDPLKALKLAEFEAPDLLIADVMMPHLSGIDLALQLRLLCPNCRVLLFSGHAGTPHMLNAARSEGFAFEFLSKPVHPADMLAKIQDLIEATQPLIAQDFGA
jgi:DNA-binding NtrC family response regulator